MARPSKITLTTRYDSQWHSLIFYIPTYNFTITSLVCGRVGGRGAAIALATGPDRSTAIVSGSLFRRSLGLFTVKTKNLTKFYKEQRRPSLFGTANGCWECCQLDASRNVADGGGSEMVLEFESVWMFTRGNSNCVDCVVGVAVLVSFLNVFITIGIRLIMVLRWERWELWRKIVTGILAENMNVHSNNMALILKILLT